MLSAIDKLTLNENKVEQKVIFTKALMMATQIAEICIIFYILSFSHLVKLLLNLSL